MDVIENDIRKQELRQERQVLLSKWESNKVRLNDIAHNGSCTLKGYPDKPEVINKLESVWLAIHYQNRVIPIDQYSQLLREEYQNLVSTVIPKVGERSVELEVQVKELEELVFEGNIIYEKLGQEIAQERDKIRYLRSQLIDVAKDIEGYKAEIKLQTLGSTLDFNVSKEICPTCQQNINGSLLPQNIHQQIMTADENLTFLRLQKKMIEVYLQTAEQTITRNELQIQQISSKLREQRTEIRAMKRTLMTDDRLPSEADIEKKLILKQQLDFYVRLEEKFNDARDGLTTINENLINLLAAESRIPRNLISALDARKHNEMEEYFRVLLGRFGYTSKDPQSIRISVDKYQPTVEGLALRKEFIDRGKQNYDIRYDSSASDFVRTIWAYTCVLYKVSSSFNGHHPGLIIMDEPEQHSMSDQSIRSLLTELSKYKNFQSIVAASFHNEDSIFEKAVSNLECTIFNLGKKAITKINKNNKAD